jgi:hypothetical protein
MTFRVQHYVLWFHVEMFLCAGKAGGAGEERRVVEIGATSR